MLQYPCRSFVSITFFSFAFNFACAATTVIDDRSQNIQWNGAWEVKGNQPAPTWDGSLHWGNSPGLTATYTFTGPSIQVVGAFKPIGTWIMKSQYTIDDGEPTVFTPPPEVTRASYAQTFFDSGPLPAGEHTLLIRNLGEQLWIDCLRVSDDPASITTSAVGTLKIGNFDHPSKTSSRLPSSATTTTFSTTSSSTLVQPIDSTSIVTTSWVQLINSTSIVTLSLSISPSTSSVIDSNSQLPPSFATSSSAFSTIQAQETTPTHSPERNRAQVNGLSIGLVVALVVVLGTLLGTTCWYRRRPSRNRTPVQPYASFSSEALIQHDSQPTVPILDDNSGRSLSSASLNLSLPISRPASSVVGSLNEHTGDIDIRRQSQVSAQWSVDGGVRIAGGPYGGDAPSIAERQNLKDKFPPPYQAYPSA
ncbi:hypothetical protein BD311DRAFT_139890 [Dichomitus squalens]|uniref:Uncharacterized protein n=1 Tax=Dichomitus squalens TaxID=114155 RepID=A0A4Q9M8S6_9APHY|nr:hypothetical protein BD311DRAFT_139890 [Dichomitus squalens]